MGGIPEREGSRLGLLALRAIESLSSKRSLERTALRKACSCTFLKEAPRTELQEPEPMFSFCCRLQQDELGSCHRPGSCVVKH